MSEVAKLYGEQAFPVAVAHGDIPKAEDVGNEPTPSMLHAALFAIKMKSGAWPFGASGENSAKALHAIADAIERKELLVQRVSVESVATVDDLTMSVLTFAYVEKLP